MSTMPASRHTRSRRTSKEFAQQHSGNIKKSHFKKTCKEFRSRTRSFICLNLSHPHSNTRPESYAPTRFGDISTWRHSQRLTHTQEYLIQTDTPAIQAQDSTSRNLILSDPMNHESAGARNL